MAADLLDRRVEYFGAEHEQTIAARHNLATVYGRQKLWAKAEAQYRTAYEDYRRLYGYASDNTIKIATEFGWVLQELGKDDEAEQLLGESLSHLLSEYGAAHHLCRRLFLSYGPLLVKRGECERAEPLYREIVETAAVSEGQDRLIHAGLMCDHGACLTKMQRYKEAEDSLLRGYEQMKAFGEPQRARAAAMIDKLYEAWGKPELARELHRRLEGSAKEGANPRTVSGSGQNGDSIER